MPGENEVEISRGNGLFQPFRAVAMQRDAALAVEHELRRFGAFDAVGAGAKGQIFQMHPVAIADGDVGADAVLLAGGRNQVQDVFSGISAMDEMLRAVFQKQIQRAPGFGQAVVRVGNQANFHARQS